MMTNRTSSEQDRRLAILNTLLTTPHRQLANVHPIHQEMITSDPLFYSRLAAWYFAHGEVRDHKEMFVINLVLSNFEDHRETGLAMLRELPPYQVQRIVDFIHGRKKTSTLVDRKTKESVSITEEFGLFRNVPRSVKTEVTRYLRERETDDDWFDSSVLVARKAMKRLYAVLHIQPSKRAQAVLFDRQPPTGSKLAAVKALRSATDPEQQARAIIKHRIPYRVASTVISAMTPTVIFALIDVMSDQELINNVGSLRRRGAFDNAELKTLISARLDKAKTGKRISALKSIEAAKAAKVDDETRKQLEKVADVQVKSKGRIKRPTAILVDKSGSMSQAIEVGKRVASLTSTIMDAPLYVYAFDGIAYPVAPPAANDLSAWEKAFAGIKAGGCTSCGVGVEMLRRNKQPVEQILMVTDESENSSPRFAETMLAYQKELNVQTHVVFLKVGDFVCDQLEKECRASGISHDAYTFSGDYYSLPNLIQYLTRPSRLDLLMEIMSHPLPQRKAA